MLCAKKPCAKKLHIDKKLLIMSSSSLPGNFFGKKALVAPYMLENGNKIETTVLLDTEATRYSFVNVAIRS